LHYPRKFNHCGGGREKKILTRASTKLNANDRILELAIVPCRSCEALEA
jgi:hypothetical protein